MMNIYHAGMRGQSEPRGCSVRRKLAVLTVVLTHIYIINEEFKAETECRDALVGGCALKQYTQSYTNANATVMIQKPMFEIDDLENKSVTGHRCGHRHRRGGQPGIRQGQGARVAVHWHSKRDAAMRWVRGHLTGPTATAVARQGDLTKRGVPGALSTRRPEFSAVLEILINNAGSLVSRRRFLEEDDAWVDAVSSQRAGGDRTSQAAFLNMRPGAEGGASSMWDPSRDWTGGGPAPACRVRARNSSKSIAASLTGNSPHAH